MLLIFFRWWQRVWNFKRASVKNPPGGITGQHQQKWIKKCEEKRLLNLFCLLTARGRCSEYYYLWGSPVRAIWRYLLEKWLALWASCCWSLLAQCSFVGLVILFLLSCCIYSATSQAIFTQIKANVHWNLSPIGVSAYSWVFWINLSFLVLLILQVQSLGSRLIA